MSGASDNLILYNSGDGNDRIEGFNATSTLQIGNGTYSKQVIDSDIIVTVDKYRVTLVSAANLSSVNIIGNEYIWNVAGNAVINTGNGNEYIYNTGFNTTINAGAGDDFIHNYSGGSNSSLVGGDNADTIENDAQNVVIEAGFGNDHIANAGSNVTISAGAGNDFIHNYSSGSNSSLVGGDNDDTIENDAQNVVIETGFGNDHIANAGSNVKVSAGAGDDTIFLDGSAQNNMIKYKIGDGNKTILGFKASSTLSITGDFSSMKSGSDIVVTVGDGKITLVGAANLSNVNIFGTDVSTPTWTLNGTTATYGTLNNILATVSGGELLPPLEAGASWINEVAPLVTPYFLSHKRYFP